MRAVAHGIDNVEELDRVKREEAEHSAPRREEEGQTATAAAEQFFANEAFDWSAMSVDNPSFSAFLKVSQGDFDGSSLIGAGRSSGA